MHQITTTVRRIIRLDGRAMTDRGETHRYLKDRFGFPDYYGNNLDALYDLLTEIGMPTKIILTETAALLAAQGDYGRALLNVFEDADTNNARLEVVLRD